MAGQRRPTLIGWILPMAFFSIPAAILHGISTSMAVDARWASRLDRLESLPSGERFITGQAQLAPGHEMRVAPESKVECLAWQTSISVSWTSTDSEGDESTSTRMLRSGSDATRMVVVDDRAGLLATLEGKAVTILGQGHTLVLPSIPEWSARLEKLDDDTTGDRTYSSEERVVGVGQRISFFAKAGEPVSPIAGEARLEVYPGTASEWRESMRGQESGAMWMRRISLTFVGVIALLGLGLMQALVIRRRQSSSR